MDNKIALTDENTTGKVLDHLGLVMSTIDRLGIIEKIDQHIPIATEKNPKTTIGQRVAAMILNGLGFVDTRLYMFPDFLKNKPVARLLGDGLKAEYFNDDALGRCLDKVYDYGVTKLFSELAFDIGVQQGLLGRSAHVDTTSLSVYGDYDDQDEQEELLLEQSQDAAALSADGSHLAEKKSPIVVTYGHSKAHRPDLKQVVLNLATTGAAGFPIWMEPHSGNASDQKELRAAAERMQKFCSKLKEAPSFMYVADSAMYISCLEKGGDLKWLSRVPEKLKWAKELLQHKDECYTWIALANGYRICILETKYGAVHQRLCIVSSEQAYKRELKTFNKNLKKQCAKHEKSLWHLSNQEFGCVADADKAVKALNKTMNYHAAQVTTEAIKKYKNKGRPKPDEQPQIVGYKVVGSLVERTELIEKTRRRKGRFLLSTNELDQTELSDEEILPEYKEQSKTESGFKFIKDNTFEVASIFLKKASRIEALMMIMTLCLMVYSVAQYQFRESLKNVDLAEFDPDNKLTKKPTMKRIFKLFYGVHELTVKLGEDIQCLIINMNDLTKNIVRCFGKKAVVIYGISG